MRTGLTARVLAPSMRPGRARPGCMGIVTRRMKYDDVPSMRPGRARPGCALTVEGGPYSLGTLQ